MHKGPTYWVLTKLNWQLLLWQRPLRKIYIVKECRCGHESFVTNALLSHPPLNMLDETVFLGNTWLIIMENHVLRIHFQCVPEFSITNSSTGWFFNGSSRFSLPKWKTNYSLPEKLFSRNFHLFLILNIGRKKHPVLLQKVEVDIHIRLNAMARDKFLFVKIMRSTYGFHRSNCPNSWAPILKSNIGSPRVSQLSLQTVSPILSQSLLLSSIIFENWTELYTVRSDKPLIFN